MKDRFQPKKAIFIAHPVFCLKALTAKSCFDIPVEVCVVMYLDNKSSLFHQVMETSNMLDAETRGRYARVGRRKAERSTAVPEAAVTSNPGKQA